ncbi:MAG: glycerate kinase [Polyangiales bacterium]
MSTPKAVPPSPSPDAARQDRDTLTALLRAAGPLPRELVAWLEQHPDDALACDAWNLAATAQARLTALPPLVPVLQQVVSESCGLSTLPWPLIWRLWLPLALHTEAEWRAAGRPWVLGLLGPQGSGKSTLADALVHLLAARGRRAATVSIDDFYLPLAERQVLQAQDPRFRFRGPPGTHDLQALQQVLTAVHGKAPTLALPRFDKALHAGQGDRIAPRTVAELDVLVLEGWCVGLRPIDSAAFDHAPTPIDSAADRAFARDCNGALAAYEAAWDQLDSLGMLALTDPDASRRWRRAAEDKLRAQGRGGMTPEAIDAFVAYFHRALHPALFYPALEQHPCGPSWVARFDADRTLTALVRGPRQDASGA